MDYGDFVAKYGEDVATEFERYIGFKSKSRNDKPKETPSDKPSGASSKRDGKSESRQSSQQQAPDRSHQQQMPNRSPGSNRSNSNRSNGNRSNSNRSHRSSSNNPFNEPEDINPFDSVSNHVPSREATPKSSADGNNSRRGSQLSGKSERNSNNSGKESRMAASVTTGGEDSNRMPTREMAEQQAAWNYWMGVYGKDPYGKDVYGKGNLKGMPMGWPAGPPGKGHPGFVWGKGKDMGKGMMMDPWGKGMMPMMYPYYPGAAVKGKPNMYGKGVPQFGAKGPQFAKGQEFVKGQEFQQYYGGQYGGESAGDEELAQEERMLYEEFLMEQEKLMYGASTEESQEDGDGTAASANDKGSTTMSPKRTGSSQSSANPKTRSPKAVKANSINANSSNPDRLSSSTQNVPNVSGNVSYGMKSAQAMYASATKFGYQKFNEPSYKKKGASGNAVAKRFQREKPASMVEKELKECTFKPNVADSTKKKKNAGVRREI
jgi:hypothetical protein